MSARVRIPLLSAGPEGVRHPGSVYEVADDGALELVEAHAAELVVAARERTVTGAPETATQPRGR